MTNITTEQVDKIAKQPVDKIHLGSVYAAIWANETERGTYHTVTFEKRYRDSEGNWHSTDSYGLDDLLNKKKLTDLVHTKILALRAAAKAAKEN